MLYLAGDTGKPRRLQGAFVSEKEVKDVVKFIKMQAENMEVPAEGELGFNFENSAGGQGSGIGGDDNAEDDLYSEAKEVVVLAGKASASLLQRRLRVGYARAARLLDILEDKGIIGPGDGAKPREVYVSKPSEEVSPESVSLEATGVVADTIEAEKEEEI